jgi:hypothetical protein
MESFYISGYIDGLPQNIPSGGPHGSIEKALNYKYNKELNDHRLKPMGWRALAESQLGRTPSFTIYLEIFIFGSLHLALLLDIFHDHLIRNISGSTAKYPRAQSC